MIGATKTKIKKPLGVFSLAMMNVIAVDSLRSLPIAALFGYALIFFYLLAALLFFIPTALVTAELATTWPSTGGAYIWIRTAFGARWGWFAIWLQWVYNVVWYPTILSFVIAAFAYLIDPQLMQHKIYLLSTILIIWWLVTALSCLGLRVSSWLSSIGALVGTLIPMLFMIVLAIIWIKTSHPLAIHFSYASFFPSLNNFNNLAFLTTIIFGLMGLEMSAVHAGDVRNPQQDFPRALFWSTNSILISLIMASLAIALIIPANQLSILSGLTEAYVAFFNSYHLSFFIPIIISLIIIGSLCSISTWVIGPTRGLLIATFESQIAGLNWLLKINRFGAPVGLLVFQGVLVSLLTSLFILIPSVTETYWLLSVMTAQLAVLFYFFLFLSALQLRYKEADRSRAYHIPGGKWGIWTVCIMGLVGCLITFILGFFPPSGIAVSNLLKFDKILLAGLLLFCLPPFICAGWALALKKIEKNNQAC
ncbi:MAG: amino acid permease [Gammaproteobacteria bacterium]|nr:MAG: amino acid permease [Gammaproteobacteria bacterium]